ncbi:hypothetical protein ZIOFF_009264 [Zingiber officinale]|uniref:Uncharacterized protein n=1 Tax=Zingiber officinale TaxID=94328 RepID=A0A8J5I3G1_ZINOF|nr:hypothetical protein ZIOFF_009264 [Zingiber officinale]
MRRSVKTGGVVTGLVTAVDLAPCGNGDATSEAILIKWVDEKVAMDSDNGVLRELSELQKKRTEYQPELPPCLQVFLLLRGTEGLFAQKTLEFTNEVLATYKNQGVTSNSDAAQLAETFAEDKCTTKIQLIRLSSLSFIQDSSSSCYITYVVGVPVTLYGDLKNQFVETNVGFDTVNSQLISNVCMDALSAEKYYYFIRLMGPHASHVAAECALQSHPNMVLSPFQMILTIFSKQICILILGEEVALSKLTLFDITKQICDAVQARAAKDKYHGVILIPKGLIASIPELYALLQVVS